MQKGLTNSQVKTLQLKYGFNEIPSPKEFRAFKIFLSQFTSFLILILIAAGSISIFLGETLDGIAIFAIVVINSLIGFFQEYKAENAVQALKKLVIQEAIVIRNGEEQSIPIRQLVPGDLVILGEGDKIPADLEIIEAFSLKVDEAVLTGESTPSEKSTTKENNLLYKGTIIVTGRATAKVIGTGANTEFGKIVSLISKQTKTRSPLTIQLDNLGKKVGLVILGLIVILFILGQIRDISLIRMLMISVSLGVSAIPEGMPIIVTLTLAIGVSILARKNAIVRKMNSVETLGATTYICSDKTGTLTLNEMTVKKIWTSTGELEIPGQGYSWKDKVKLNNKDQEKLIQVGENCNNSFVGKNILGDPTEIALKILARKSGTSKDYKKIDEIVFTSDRKMMSTLHSIGTKKEIFAKGAFEEILARCTHILKNGKAIKLTSKDKKEIETNALNYAEQALRVLAMAYKPYTNNFNEEDLIFVGLCAMIDPPRKSVRASIEAAHQAGIQVRIITGDNAITAKAIGAQIGLKSANTL
ncbi:HAD-IC family P-type ATPase, partial [Patescibacteria group bacterium]|nr:HAD-IC family P-type ATPase [Patescibacteria group bacterium]